MSRAINRLNEHDLPTLTLRLGRHGGGASLLGKDRKQRRTMMDDEAEAARKSKKRLERSLATLVRKIAQQNGLVVVPAGNGEEEMIKRPEWLTDEDRALIAAKEFKDKAARRWRRRPLRLPNGKFASAPTFYLSPGQVAAAKKAGMSPDQVVEALCVAAVPREEFERQVESDNPLSVAELARQGREWLREAQRN
jgi:hypothetical protein